MWEVLVNKISSWQNCQLDISCPKSSKDCAQRGKYAGNRKLNNIRLYPKLFAFPLKHETESIISLENNQEQ